MLIIFTMVRARGDEKSNVVIPLYLQWLHIIINLKLEAVKSMGCTIRPFQPEF
jgi:hypothetical protein